MIEGLKTYMKVPKISPKNLSSQVGPSNLNSKLTYIRDFGIFKLDSSLTSNPNFPRNSYTRINISDFFGQKLKNEFISAGKLIPLKMKLKKQKFLMETAQKSSLSIPGNPRRMDENTKLRLFLQKSKLEQQLNRKKELTNKNLSLPFTKSKIRESIKSRRKSRESMKSQDYSKDSMKPQNKSIFFVKNSGILY